VSKPDPHVSAYPTEDGMLALERLIVGRECNGFDRLSPARKSRAFAELIHLGYAYGKAEDVAGQDFPNVTIQRVSSRGHRLRSSARAARVGGKGKGVTILWLFAALAAALIGCLLLIFRVL
jgi:hypothetical protein